MGPSPSAHTLSRREASKALAAVPAHALKQAAQVRDLTTVRHVVPGHLPQGGSHGGAARAQGG